METCVRAAITNCPLAQMIEIRYIGLATFVAENTER